jgi:hypothetical protein
MWWYYIHSEFNENWYLETDEQIDAARYKWDSWLIIRLYHVWYQSLMCPRFWFVTEQWSSFYFQGIWSSLMQFFKIPSDFAHFLNFYLPSWHFGHLNYVRISYFYVMHPVVCVNSAFYLLFFLEFLFTSDSLVLRPIRRFPFLIFIISWILASVWGGGLACSSLCVSDMSLLMLSTYPVSQESTSHR